MLFSRFVIDFEVKIWKFWVLEVVIFETWNCVWTCILLEIQILKIWSNFMAKTLAISHDCFEWPLIFPLYVTFLLFCLYTWSFGKQKPIQKLNLIYYIVKVLLTLIHNISLARSVIHLVSIMHLEFCNFLIWLGLRVGQSWD